MNETPIQKAIRLVGGQSEIARRLHIKPQSVRLWLLHDNIPPYRVLDVERLTGMKVSCHDLAPKLYPRDRFPVDARAAGVLAGKTHSNKGKQ